MGWCNCSKKDRQSPGPPNVPRDAPKDVPKTAPNDAPRDASRTIELANQPKAQPRENPEAIDARRRAAQEQIHAWRNTERILEGGPR